MPPPPRRLLVADAGPLIALGVAGLLAHTSAHFGGLWVPQAVMDECTGSTHAPGAKEVAEALAAKHLHVVEQSRILPLDAAYALGLGSGEAAVLAYARQHHYLALIDDQKAHTMAARLGVSTVRSGAVLLALKAAGRVPSIAPALDAFKRQGYFLAPSVTNRLLQLAGEMQD